MNIALVLAGGKANRMHQAIPKQFIHVNNKPIIIYVLEAYQNHPLIDEIYAVCIDGWEEILYAYAKQFNITKLKHIIPGGKSGQESIYNGINYLNEIKDKNDNILVQDANRPMVDESIISGALAVCQKYGDAVTSLLMSDVYFDINEENQGKHIPREHLWGSQTPQIYPLGKLVWAFNEAEKRGIDTSSASCVLIMNSLGEPIHVYPSTSKNIKITTVEDIEVFKALLNVKKDDWLI